MGAEAKNTMVQNDSLGQKIVAVANLMKNGSGPTFKFVKGQFRRKITARSRRKSVHIQRHSVKYQHSAFLCELIKKFLYGNDYQMRSSQSNVRRTSVVSGPFFPATYRPSAMIQRTSSMRRSERITLPVTPESRESSFRRVSFQQTRPRGSSVMEQARAYEEMVAQRNSHGFVGSDPLVDIPSRPKKKRVLRKRKLRRRKSRASRASRKSGRKSSIRVNVS